MRRLLLVAGLALASCGNGAAGTPVGRAPSADEGYIRFVLLGGRLDTPVEFEGTSTRLKAMLSVDQPSIAFRQDPIRSTAGAFIFKQLTMKLANRHETTHTDGAFETTFTIEGPMNEDGSLTTFSIKASGQDSGSITITEVGDRLRGTFDITGRPTQVNGRDQQFRVEGTFDFARCVSLICL